MEVRDEGPEETAGEEHSASNNKTEDPNGETEKSKDSGRQINLRTTSSRPLDSRIDSSLDTYASQSTAESNTNKPTENKDKL